MPEAIIQVEGLGKRFLLGEINYYFTLRDFLSRLFSKPFRSLGNRKQGARQKARQSYLWALRDLSFEVKQGEILGIIGNNGEGKSTLLKILSRITTPTCGRAFVRGRVGSLLDVGIGFHPELTGRENIFLNGAILGMKRFEIQRKFDEIVAFAEVEKFLDTPVKFFSSGMYVRLAFSVAAHLDSEILLVDEVLAVGDISFQQKCLAKMESLRKENNRTILLVSHDMNAIRKLCNSAILLKGGDIKARGHPSEVIDDYLREYYSASLSWERSAPPREDAFIEKILFSDHQGQPIKLITTATDIAVGIDYCLRHSQNSLQLQVALTDLAGNVILTSTPRDGGINLETRKGRFRTVFFLPRNILLPRTYGIMVSLGAGKGKIIDFVDKLTLQVHADGEGEAASSQERAGFLALKCRWEVTDLS